LKLYWRPLIPGEHDSELIWGAVIAAAALLAAAWLLLGLPTPLCPLHSLTGFSCPTCGITRGLRCLLHGNLEAAFLFNPLGMALLFGAAYYLLYAAIVVIGRLPRLRWDPLSKTAGVCVRITVILAVAANWIYLIAREQSVH